MNRRIKAGYERLSTPTDEEELERQLDRLETEAAALIQAGFEQRLKPAVSAFDAAMAQARDLLRKT